MKAILFERVTLIASPNSTILWTSTTLRRQGKPQQRGLCRCWSRTPPASPSDHAALIKRPRYSVNGSFTLHAKPFFTLSYGLGFWRVRRRFPKIALALWTVEVFLYWRAKLVQFGVVGTATLYSRYEGGEEELRGVICRAMLSCSKFC